jgi:Ca2+-binding EF-hand superfamily protein
VFHRPIGQPAIATIFALAVFASPVAAAAQSGTQQSGGAAAAQPMTRSALSSQLDTSFANLDTNKDKSLNKAEVEAAQARNVAQAQAAITKRIETEFAKLDGNKDGQLSLAEFKGAAPSPRAAPVDDLMKQLDRNGDGKVSADEYRAVPLGNFDRLDTNKDGTISAQEQAAAKQR